ncbi:Phosphatidylinositol 5-phosphate 4-kinase type-2 gamma [Halotydeus destructor]|nr:Phosphatidylinositol 5-phosphate 4-kinase type-2 gamma [Halotydeus destructor]
MSSPPMSSVFSASSTSKQKHLKVKQQKRVGGLGLLQEPQEPVLAVFVWSVAGQRHLNWSSVPPPLVLPEHFKACVKTKVAAHGHALTTRHGLHLPQAFKVKEYCPQLFAVLRERVFGLTNDAYFASLTTEVPLQEEPTTEAPLAAAAGPEPSLSHQPSVESCGDLSWVSADGLLHVRQVQSEHVEQLHSLLKAYHPFVVQRGRSRLPQYLGLYRVTTTPSGGLRKNESPKNTYLLVTRNLLSAPSFRWSRLLSGREASGSAPSSTTSSSTGPAPSASSGLRLTAADRDRLVDTLQADVDFLANHNLVDYVIRVACHRSGSGGTAPTNQRAALEQQQRSSLDGSPPPPPPPGASGAAAAGRRQSSSASFGSSSAAAAPPPLVASNGGSQVQADDQCRHYYALPSVDFYRQDAQSEVSSRQDDQAPDEEDFEQQQPQEDVYFVGLVDFLPLMQRYKKKTTTASSSSSAVNEGGDQQQQLLTTTGANPAVDSSGAEGGKAGAQLYARRIMDNLKKCLLVE